MQERAAGTPGIEQEDTGKPSRVSITSGGCATLSALSARIHAASTNSVRSACIRSRGPIRRAALRGFWCTRKMVLNEAATNLRSTSASIPYGASARRPNCRMRSRCPRGESSSKDFTAPPCDRTTLSAPLHLTTLFERAALTPRPFRWTRPPDRGASTAHPKRRPTARPTDRSTPEAESVLPTSRTAGRVRAFFEHRGRILKHGLHPQFVDREGEHLLEGDAASRNVPLRRTRVGRIRISNVDVWIRMPVRGLPMPPEQFVRQSFVLGQRVGVLVGHDFPLAGVPRVVGIVEHLGSVEVERPLLRTTGEPDRCRAEEEKPTARRARFANSPDRRRRYAAQ